jgi:tetratricopeptide (TPR) repeat protein
VSLVAAGRTSEARERTDALQRDGRLAPGPAAEAWLVEARVSLLDGDPSAADTALANILALASEHGLPAAETIALACRARTRWEMGDPGGALAFAELARTRLASAQDDPDTLLVAELCLAVHAEERGEGETALTSYARLRELAAARYGADHPTALVHARRHAQSLYRLQRYEDAETALGDIDLGLAQSLGRDHPATLDAEMLRALVDAEIGDGAAAMAAMIDVHARYARVVGPDHIMVATALHNLAVLHMRAHRAAHALGPARRAHAVRLAKLGAHHRATLETASPLAIAMDATGDRPGAIAFLEQAIASAAPALGEQHPVLLRVQAVLLQFEVCEEHEAARRVDEARELVARIRAHAPIPAAERPAQHALAIASRAAGRYDESLRIRRELHSAGCPTGRDDTRVCHGSAFQLARAQLDAGETEALADATRALDEYARDPGATLRDVSMMHLALADTLEHTGRLGEAAREYEAALPGMVVGGASRLGRGAIAWGAARMLARSSEQQRALLDIARAAFVAEHASESVAEIDAWLESRR